MINHGRLVPSFIKSRSPSGLRRLMVENNLKHHGMVQYFDIQSYIERGKQAWIAWFYIDFSNENIKEIITDDKEV